MKVQVLRRKIESSVLKEDLRTKLFFEVASRHIEWTKTKTRIVLSTFFLMQTKIGANRILANFATGWLAFLMIFGSFKVTEVGIYKRKQDSKKTRKHAFDQESD